MNWEAVGAIGEVVGAFGVILTLGYLAIQVRQNSAVVRSSTRQAISTAQSEIGYRLAENSELRAAVLQFTNLDSTIPDTQLAAHFYESVRAISPELARRIIFSTGDVASDDARSFLERTGNPYLQKPFELAAMRRIVAQVTAKTH